MSIIDRKLLILFVVIISLITLLSIPSNSKLGEIYFKSYRYELALEYFNKSKTLDANSPKTLRQLKDYFLVQGEVDKALQLQVKICEVLTRSKKDLEELSRLYEWTNRPYESLKTKERLAALMSSEERNVALHHIGQGYRWLRKYDDADRVVNSLDNSERIDYLISDLEYYVSSSNFKKVIDLTNRLRRLGVNSDKFKLLQAQSYEVQGQIPEAIIAYKKYLSNDPSFHHYDAYKIVPNEKFYKNNLRTYEKIIDLHQRQKDDTILVDLYEEIFKVNPNDYETALSAIVLHYKKNEIAQMISLLDKVYNSHNSRDLYRSGDLLRLLKESKRALSHLRKAHELSPTNTDILEALVDTYEEMGKDRRALYYQYKLLKILKKKELNKKSSFHYLFESELYAQANGNYQVPKNKTKIRDAQKKILYLLEKVGDKVLRHEELLRYVKIYPLDTRIKSELAYSFVLRGDQAEAERVYNEIYEINNQDRDAVFFLVDEHLKKYEYLDAQRKMLMLPEDGKDYAALNRLEMIYRELDQSKADELCSHALENVYVDLKDYGQVNLIARCYDYAGDSGKAVSVLLDYLRLNSSDKYAKISLAYYLIKSHRLLDAETVIRNLHKEYPKDIDVFAVHSDLKSYKLRRLRERAWQHSGYVHLFSDRFNGLSYWDSDFKLTKHFWPWAFSTSYSLQNPYYNSSLISDFKVHASYEQVDSYFSEIYIGKNLVNSSRLNAGGSFYKNINSRFSLFADVNLNKQVYEVNTFTKEQKPSQDNYSLSLNQIYNRKHNFSYALEHYSFKLYEGREKIDYIYASFFWNYNYSKRIVYGPYLYERRSLSSTDYIATLLPDFVSTQCMHLKYRHKLKTSENPHTNESDACVGATRSNSSGLGGYINLVNTTKIELAYDYEFELRFEYDQPIYQDLNQVFSIYAGYNYWIF